jgi:short-subunit dehydrogenase
MSDAGARMSSSTAITVGGRPVALITGATAGIGKVFAERLAAKGHDLVLVARDAERLRTTATELASTHGISAETLAADLTTSDGLQRVCARIGKLAQLDMLVNNAGFGTKGKLANRPLDEQERMLALHVTAPMVLTRTALPGMLARRTGTIINVASVASWVYSPGTVNYSATKAYLRVFTQGLALELAGTGVHAQVLCPGFTRTEFHERAAIGATSIPGPLWLDVHDVVDASLAQAARRGPTVCVPSLRFKLIVLGLRFVPDWLLAGVRRRYSRARMD